MNFYTSTLYIQKLLPTIKLIKSMVYHKLALKNMQGEFELINSVFLNKYEKINFTNIDD